MTNQTPKMSLLEMATVTGTSPFDIQNWLKRLSFTTRFTKTQQGRAQKFSRDNCIEISLINRLVRVFRMTPAAAAERARLLLKTWKGGETPEWVLIVNDEFEFEGKVMSFDGRPDAELIERLSQAGCYMVLNVGQLVDRIDAHFDDQEQKGAA
jgi:hypothetical protein